jgi:hypothetical protein
MPDLRGLRAKEIVIRSSDSRGLVDALVHADPGLRKLALQRPFQVDPDYELVSEEGLAAGRLGRAFSSLEELVIDDFALTTAIWASPHLTLLSITWVSNISVGQVSALRSLRRLHIKGDNPFDDADMATIVSNCSELEELALYGMDHLEGYGLRPTPNSDSRLERLACNNMNRLKNDALKLLEGAFPRLTHLAFFEHAEAEESDVTSDGVARLAASHGSTLRELDVQGSPTSWFSEEEMHRLAVACSGGLLLHNSLEEGADPAVKHTLRLQAGSWLAASAPAHWWYDHGYETFSDVRCA